MLPAGVAALVSLNRKRGGGGENEGKGGCQGVMGGRWGVRSLVQEVKAHCAAAAAHQEVSDGQTPFPPNPHFLASRPKL